VQLLSPFSDPNMDLFFLAVSVRHFSHAVAVVTGVPATSTTPGHLKTKESLANQLSMPPGTLEHRTRLKPSFTGFDHHAGLRGTASLLTQLGPHPSCLPLPYPFAVMPVYLIAA